MSDDAEYDADSLSSDEQELLDLLRDRKISAGDVTARIQKAVGTRDQASPGGVVTRDEAAKMVRTAVDTTKQGITQQMRAEKLQDGVRAVVREVADASAYPASKRFRRGMVEEVMQKVGERKDLAELDDQDFETVVRETAKKVVEEASQEIVAAAGSLKDKVPPPDKQGDTTVLDKKEGASAAEAVGQTPPGEAPPRSEAKQASETRPGQFVTNENLDDAYGREDVVWPTTDAAVQAETSRAADDFLRQAARKE
jgi:hypothetical protein